MRSERRSHACQFECVMLGITGARKIRQANVFGAYTNIVQSLLQYVRLHVVQSGVTPWGGRYSPPPESAYLGQNRRPTRPCMRRRFDNYGGGSLAQHWTIMTLIKGPTRFLAAATWRWHPQLHQGFIQQR